HFIRRDLFKYIEVNPDEEAGYYQELEALFERAGIDSRYYLRIDSSSDLPYDVYRAGEGRTPIYLQMPSGEEKELSEHSVIVDSITGKKRVDHKLYYPEDSVLAIQDQAIKNAILEQLKKMN